MTGIPTVVSITTDRSLELHFKNLQNRRTASRRPTTCIDKCDVFKVHSLLSLWVPKDMKSVPKPNVACSIQSDNATESEGHITLLALGQGTRYRNEV